MRSSWRGNSIYAIPRRQPSKRKAKGMVRLRKELAQIASLKAQNRRLKTQIKNLEKFSRKLRREGKGSPIYAGYREHIANLHAEIQRLRDPSIPRRAVSKLRKAASRIEDIPNLRLHAAEKVFVQEAIDQGYLVYRNGWPDFLLIHKKSGESRFVEVKSPADGLSDSQIAMFEALEKCGLVVEVYRAGKQAQQQVSSWRKLHPEDASPERAAMSCRGGENT